MTLNTFDYGNLTFLPVSDEDFILLGYSGGVTPSGDLVVPSTIPTRNGDRKVTGISSCSFSGCPIESLYISEGVESIGSCAFNDCKSLKKIILPRSLREISSSAFIRCGLESLSLPGSVRWLGASAFARCPNLSQISLPPILGELNWSFEKCPSIELIEIPESVKFLKGGEFAGCRSLKTIILDNPHTLVSTHVCDHPVNICTKEVARRVFALRSIGEVSI